MRTNKMKCHQSFQRIIIIIKIWVHDILYEHIKESRVDKLMVMEARPLSLRNSDAIMVLNVLNKLFLRLAVRTHDRVDSTDFQANVNKSKRVYELAC